MLHAPLSKRQPLRHLLSVLYIRWSAPEVVVEGRFSREADVFSFGVVLWELLTLQVRLFLVTGVLRPNRLPQRPCCLSTWCCVPKHQAAKHSRLCGAPIFRSHGAGATRSKSWWPFRTVAAQSCPRLASCRPTWARRRLWPTTSGSSRSAGMSELPTRAQWRTCAGGAATLACCCEANKVLVHAFFHSLLASSCASLQAACCKAEL